MHGVNVVGVAGGNAEFALVVGELGPHVVLVEGSGLLAEGIVEVEGRLLALARGDEPGRAEVVEREVADVARGLGGEQRPPRQIQSAVATQLVPFVALSSQRPAIESDALLKAERPLVVG